MKKKTKAILLTALTVTGCGGSVFHEGYDVYGPGPDIQDSSNDVIESLIADNPSAALPDDEERP